MRAGIRWLFDRAVWGMGVLALSERRMRGGITILMYHRVLPDDRSGQYPLRALAISASAFDRQMNWLAEHCRVTTVADALTALAAPDDSDQQPRVCVTFDDGYDDNALVAAPVLRKYDLLATFYVTAGAVATGELLWFDRAILIWRGLDDAGRAAVNRELGGRVLTCGGFVEALKWVSPEVRIRILATGQAEDATGEFRLMTPRQVLELRQAGHEIGSHTLSHPLLDRLDDQQLRRELVESRNLLEQWCAGPVTGICYPNGNFDERVMAEARSAGYAHGCTTASGLNRKSVDPLKLSRVGIFPDRVTNRRGVHDTMAFRAEISRIRRFLHSW